MGIEPTPDSRQETVILAGGGAESGALVVDPELAELVKAWAGLPEDVRNGIVAIARASRQT